MSKEEYTLQLQINHEKLDEAIFNHARAKVLRKGSSEIDITYEEVKKAEERLSNVQNNLEKIEGFSIPRRNVKEEIDSKVLNLEKRILENKVGDAEKKLDEAIFNHVKAKALGKKTSEIDITYKVVQDAEKKLIEAQNNWIKIADYSIIKRDVTKEIDSKILDLKEYFAENTVRNSEIKLGKAIFNHAQNNLEKIEESVIPSRNIKKEINSVGLEKRLSEIKKKLGIEEKKLDQAIDKYVQAKVLQNDDSLEVKVHQENVEEQQEKLIDIQEDWRKMTGIPLQKRDIQTEIEVKISGLETAVDLQRKKYAELNVELQTLTFDVENKKYRIRAANSFLDFIDNSEILLAEEDVISAKAYLQKVTGSRSQLNSGNVSSELIDSTKDRLEKLIMDTQEKINEQNLQLHRKTFELEKMERWERKENHKQVNPNEYNSKTPIKSRITSAISKSVQYNVQQQNSKQCQDKGFFRKTLER